MEIKETIANNIASLRKKAGLTQAELADRLNYSDKAISKWERAESLPDAEMLKKLADLFHVNIEYLFEDHPLVVLSKEEAKKLHDKEIAIKVIYIVSLVFILITLAAIMFVSLSDKIPSIEPYRYYYFILPAIPLLLWIINAVFGRRGIIQTVLLSLVVWSTADAIYFALKFEEGAVFAAAAVVQIAILLFPYVSQGSISKIKAKNESKKKK
jgi:transcriptional regulator with XRE-family HTH domain